MLALLGDNGAGKSTLVKCISGVHALDEGEILLDGEAVALHSPAAARRAGIETVYQDLALFDNLTPAQNFYCGREIAFPSWLPRGLRFLNGRAMEREAAAVLDRLKVRLPKFDAPVALMSGGQRQAIAVARATRLRAQGRDPRRADRGARPARVAQGARPDRAAPRRGQRGDPDHPQHGACRRARRPRRGAAPGPQGRRAEAEPGEPAGPGLDDRRAPRRDGIRRPAGRRSKGRFTRKRSRLGGCNDETEDLLGGLALAARDRRARPGAGRRQDRLHHQVPGAVLRHAWRMPPRPTPRPIRAWRSSSARARRPPTSRGRSRSSSRW